MFRVDGEIQLLSPHPPDNVDMTALLSSIRMFVWYFRPDNILLTFFSLCTIWQKSFYSNRGMGDPKRKLQMCDKFVGLMWYIHTYSSFRVKNYHVFFTRVRNSFLWQIGFNTALGSRWKIIFGLEYIQKSNEYFGGCGSFFNSIQIYSGI